MPMDQEESPQFLLSIPDVQDNSFAHLKMSAFQCWRESFLHQVRMTPDVIVIAPHAQVASLAVEFALQFQSMFVGFHDLVRPLLP